MRAPLKPPVHQQMLERWAEWVNLLIAQVGPLAAGLEDWRRAAGNIDRDYAKEYKKSRAEVKKKLDAVARLVIMY